MDLLFKLCGRDNGCNSQQLDRKGTTEYCLRNLLIILSSTYICSRYSRVSFFHHTVSFFCCGVFFSIVLLLLLLLLCHCCCCCCFWVWRLYTLATLVLYSITWFFYAYFKNPTCFCFPYLHKFWCMFYDFVQFFVLLNYKIQNSRTKQYILAIFLENAQTMRMHKQFNSMYVRMLYSYFVFTGFIFIWVVHLFLM